MDYRQRLSKSSIARRRCPRSAGRVVLRMLFLAALLSWALLRAGAQGARAIGGGKPKFCGQALNEVLDLVCVHGYYPRIKRFYKPKKDIVSEISQSPLDAARRRGHQFLPTSPSPKPPPLSSPPPPSSSTTDEHRRRRRHMRYGIVHECCRNGCIYADIMRYCL